MNRCEIIAWIALAVVAGAGAWRSAGCWTGGRMHSSPSPPTTPTTPPGPPVVLPAVVVIDGGVA